MYYLLFPVFIWSIIASFFFRNRKEIVCYPFDKASTNGMRAFAAIGIVLVHAQMYIRSPFLPFLEVSGEWNGMIVGFFFFLSGYGLIKSYLQKRDDYLNSFFRKRLKAIVPSALISIVVFWAIDNLEGIFSLEGAVKSFMKGNFIRPAGWFVQTLLIYYLVFFLSVRYIKKIPISLLVMLSFSIIWIFVIRSLELGPYIWSSVLAFNSGTYMAFYEDKLKTLYQTNPLFIVCCVMLISAIEIALFLYKDRIIPSTINCAIYPILFMFLTYSTGFVKWKWISFLGGISYEIYLMHLIVLEHSKYWHYGNTSFFFLSFIPIVLIAYVVHQLSNKLVIYISNNKLLKLYC